MERDSSAHPTTGGASWIEHRQAGFLDSPGSIRDA